LYQQQLSSEVQTVALPALCTQRSDASGTTDENISQVSKYSPQTALSLTTRWFTLQDALGKLFTGKQFKEKRRVCGIDLNRMREKGSGATVEN